MNRDDRDDSTIPDPLTRLFIGLLALAGVAAAFALVHSVWWLANYSASY